MPTADPGVPTSTSSAAAVPAATSATPRVVWVLVALNAALLCVYALLLPVFTGFDEPQHVDMALHVAKGQAWPWPAPGTEPLSYSISNASNPYYFGTLSHLPYTKDALPDRGHRASLDDLNTKPPVANYPNQMVQHPPGYYLLEAGVIKSIPGGAEHIAYDRLVSIMRLMSIVLITPMPLLVFKALRRLADPSTAVTGAALALAVPGLTRVGSDVQNDDLLVLLTSVLLLYLVRVATGDLSRRTSVIVGLLTAGALLTKGFALVLPVVVLLAYLTQCVARRPPWRPMLTALLIGGLLGGPWYLMNLIRFGAIQTQGLGKVAGVQFFGPATPGVPRPVTTYIRKFSSNMIRRFWSAIGRPDFPQLSVRLVFALTAVAVVLIVVAFARSAGRRRVLAVVLVPFPLMLALVIAGSFHRYRFNGHMVGVQGRYLYPTLLGLLVAVTLGVRALLGGSYARLGPLLAIVFALIMQLNALQTMFRAYWVPGHDVTAGLRGLFHWSPWDPVVTALPFVAAVLLALVALVMTARPRFRELA